MVNTNYEGPQEPGEATKRFRRLISMYPMLPILTDDAMPDDAMLIGLNLAFAGLSDKEKRELEDSLERVLAFFGRAAASNPYTSDFSQAVSIVLDGDSEID